MLVEALIKTNTAIKRGDTCLDLRLRFSAKFLFTFILLS
jgi:hypothetical protein